MLTVSQVSKVSGVSVRALHHYDELGLLRPSSRSEAGYRLYTDADLRRLQQVLLYRELGFPLEEIARILDDPAFDLGAALRMQRQLLAERVDRAKALIEAVDRTIESLERRVVMKKEELFEVFGFDPSTYDDEVKQRWGETDAYKESAKRTARYKKEDWQRFKAESEANVTALAKKLEAGLPASDPSVMDLAEQHRLLIDRWFYPVSYTMHRGLADMYLADERFTATYDKVRPGLAKYIHDAIHANADRQ